MNLLEKLYLRWKINKDEIFLITEGFKEAKRQNLEVNIGGEYISKSQVREGRIYLPPAKGGVDSRKLIALVADNFPEITKRYLNNKKKLII